MASELTKIAIIHLYVQGYRDEELINFELSMTSPSVIYEQEKINLWKEKIGLATTISDSKFLSREWIYHNILQLSKEDGKREQAAVQGDVEYLGKLEMTQQQSAQPPQEQPQPTNGQQPQPSGTESPEEAPQPETPSEEQQIDDVDAILSNLEQSTSNESEIEEAKVGRPLKGSVYGQDSHPRGRDPLGHKENMDGLKVFARRAPSKKSALSLEQADVSRLIKQLEAKSKQNTILHENNI